MTLTTEEKKINQLNSNKKWKALNIESVRKSGRKMARKWRKKPEWKQYSKEYFKKWREIGNNKQIHACRTLLSAIRLTLKNQKFKTHNRPMKAKNYQVLQNLRSIGWKAKMSRKLCLNHKISLNLLYEVCPDLGHEIAYDVRNIEIITRKENSSVEYRTITQATLDLAKRMERSYRCLCGLSKLIKSKMGEII